MKSAALLLAAVVLFASCSSSTLIQSDPSGAKVYMNGEYKGVTPYCRKYDRDSVGKRGL
jgi:hypothetical protein